jgi:2-succinyl-6-hydroxy-2,4-cyclohexadiene-1-carboxylate synthase
MLISYNDEISINVVYPYKSKYNKTIIFIHGFTGSLNDWDDLLPHLDENILPITYDLIGHGKSSAPENPQFYSLEFHIEILKFIIDFFNIKNFGLYGYSLGGRIALNFAVHNQLEFLIIESSSPGIKEEQGREKRYSDDLILVDFIKNNSIKSFIKLWMEKDLFKDLKDMPQNKYEKLLSQKYQNNKIGLINTFLEFSTGKMLPIWDKLSNIEYPTLLLSGSEDEKFKGIHKEMSQLLPNSQNIIIKNACHNLHNTKAETLSQFINAFISNL